MDKDASVMFDAVNLPERMALTGVKSSVNDSNRPSSTRSVGLLRSWDRENFGSRTSRSQRPRARHRCMRASNSMNRVVAIDPLEHPNDQHFDVGT